MNVLKTHRIIINDSPGAAGGSGSGVNIAEDQNTNFSGTVFNLGNPALNIIGFFQNGLRLTNGVDYNKVGNSLVLVTPAVNDSLTAVYAY